MIANEQIERLLEEHARGARCDLWEEPAAVLPAQRKSRTRVGWSLAAATCVAAAVCVVAWLAAGGDPSAPNTMVRETGDARRANGLPAAAARVRDISFDNVQLQMERDDAFEVQLLTPEVTQLAGQQVRIRGYMLPDFMASGITRFVLVRDNLECCFGPGAALYDCVLVNLEAGRSTDYRVHPVTIEGRFEIRPLGDDPARPIVLYHLVDGRVR